VRDDTALNLEPIARVLTASAHPEVDNLADWLLVSQLQIGGEAPGTPLAQGSEGRIRLRVARAQGQKCERCWHYEGDLAEHRLRSGESGRICGRCSGILQRQGT